MKILLVSATKFEINPLFKKLKKSSVKGKQIRYKFGRHSVDILITGVGMAATAFYLGKELGKKYDLAINAGVAGSFRKKITPGEVVNVTHDRFGDLGAEDGGRFLMLEEMGLKEVRRQKLEGKSLKSLQTLRKVKGITVNTVHGNSASIQKFVRKFDPDIESMEGAAFFFACNEYKTPCIQVRAISNFVERRNRKKWKLDLAIKNLNAFLEQMLLTL